VGFIVFFKWALKKKNGWFFWVVFFYSNPDLSRILLKAKQFIIYAALSNVQN